MNSFKNKNILLVLALNTSFILITAALIRLTRLISEPWIGKIKEVDLSNIMSQSEAQLQSILASMRGFILFVILTAILFILLLIINWSFCQGMIYHLLLKKKFTLKYFEKFLLLNMLWFIPWIALFLVIISGAKLSYLAVSAYSLIAIFLHFSFVLYTLFVNSKLKKLSHFKIHLKISIAKIYHFFLPYSLITITFIIISQLNRLNLNFIVIVLIYLLFFSWMQNYTKDIVLNLT